MNNAVFGKTVETLRKHRYIELVTIGRRMNYLVSKPSFHSTKFLTEKLLAVEMKKTEARMNKSVLNHINHIKDF